MFRRNLRSSIYGIATVLVLFGTQANATAADVESLFKDARSTAAELRKDAGTMETYTRSNLSWQSHAAQVTQIKDHVNKAGSILSDMQAARADAKPWHQEAIDEITPVLKELASNTSAIIEHLNSTPNQLKTPEYRDYLKDNAELAANLDKIVGEIVDADNVRAKIGELQAKLGE